MLTNEQKSIIEEMKNHFEEIESLYNELDPNTQAFVSEYHNFEGSIPHCYRAGLQATEELLRAQTAYEVGTTFKVKKEIKFNDGFVPAGTTATLTSIKHEYLLDEGSEPFNFDFDTFFAYEEEDASDGYRADLSIIKVAELLTPNTMTINGLAEFQVLEDTADIILSVEFSEETKRRHELISTTAFVTYDHNGNLQNIDLCDEGITSALKFTEDEKRDLLKYVEVNNLKDQLMEKIQSQ
jgi:hypothetical protein